MISLYICTFRTHNTHLPFYYFTRSSTLHITVLHVLFFSLSLATRIYVQVCNLFVIIFCIWNLFFRLLINYCTFAVYLIYWNRRGNFTNKSGKDSLCLRFERTTEGKIDSCNKWKLIFLLHHDSWNFVVIKCVDKYKCKSAFLRKLLLLLECEPVESTS